jgi:hypothetical protein
MSFWFVSVVPKYLNFATFSNHSLAILIFWSSSDTDSISLALYTVSSVTFVCVKSCIVGYVLCSSDRMILIILHWIQCFPTHPSHMNFILPFIFRYKCPYFFLILSCIHRNGICKYKEIYLISKWKVVVREIWCFNSQFLYDCSFHPNHIVSMDSHDIFPVGWCESNSYPLKPPCSYQVPVKQKQNDVNA